MEYRVEVKNPCRCFLRNGMSENEVFSNEADAKEYAEKMIAQMRSDFCKKHDFKLSNSFFLYTITIVSRT
jgi:hypothetical protein